MTDTMDQLQRTIAERCGADPQSSYVAQITSKGRGKLAEKLGEEAVETVIAAVADKRGETVGEAADLVFHLLVLLADMGIAWDEVLAELERREGVSGLTEKASRSR